MNDEPDRFERSRRHLEEAKAVHAQKRRTLLRVRSHAEDGALDKEQMAKLAEAEEQLDREVALRDAQVRKLEMEAMRLRCRRSP